MEPLEGRLRHSAETSSQRPLRETASQTAGPYVHIGCLPNRVGVKGIFKEDFTSNHTILDGDRITICGRVFDGEKTLCKDVMLEFWHADRGGQFADGIWHRTAADLETGKFVINTIMPGAMQDEAGNQLAPFINIWLFSRGINIALMTRIYFPEHKGMHDCDSHLSLVPADRVKTLLAERKDNGNEYIFDIHLQGEDETVFFDV